MTGEELARVVDRLVDQVSAWPPVRWATRRGTGGSAGEAGHAFAQRLADFEATATGRTPRTVPRLSNDLALVDQWRTLTRDLVAATPAGTAIPGAEEAVTSLRAVLFPA